MSNSSSGGAEIELPQQSNLDWQAMAGWLEARSIRGVEAVSEPASDSAAATFRRTVDIDGQAAAIELRQGARTGRWGDGQPLTMLLTVLPARDGDPAHQGNLQDHRDLEQLVHRAQRMLAADLPMDDALDHLGSDTVLGPLVATQPTLRPPGCWDPFETTVRAVLGQQITVSGARTIAGRLAERLGAAVTGFDRYGLTRLFPGPERIIDADLDGIGLTGSRVATLRRVAEASIDGLDLSGPGTARRLTPIRGIGDWTAQYVALRLGESDAFPASDVGLRKAAGRLVGVERLSTRELEELSLGWSPWRSVAAIHLWWSLRGD